MTKVICLESFVLTGRVPNSLEFTDKKVSRDKRAYHMRIYSIEDVRMKKEFKKWMNT